MFSTHGMCGWFSQKNKTVECLSALGFTFDLHVLGLWDSHPKGKFSSIVLEAPRRVRPLLTTHFEFLSARDVMLVETNLLMSCLPEI